ncbi:hypothetical protein P4S65_16450 [Pseudoalteromonas sp. B131b]|uniref:hypothetical protein n=1 Tax=unclassified Pseudoalteromonas TaxID=194690 RepID=UPI000BBED1AE|nr:hypothetical protein [Pseudoalteromonas sp. 1_2015MBL_MicDiv]ATG78145.1 hypothetical protein AOR04_11785 [Pseudoalteromonas sp. 1_2015MBL_MicDiv]
MKKHSPQLIACLEYALPKINKLLKHSIRTRFEFLLKAKLTIRQQHLLLQNSFIDAMALALSNAQVEHL